MKVDVNLSNEQVVSKQVVQKETKTIESTKATKVNNDLALELVDVDGNPTKEAYQIAVNKLNGFMDFTQKKSKFIFHEDLNKYYVEIVDSVTDEVVKEIPPKELLDAYYEMQKLVGKMFDHQV